MAHIAHTLTRTVSGLALASTLALGGLTASHAASSSHGNVWSVGHGVTTLAARHTGKVGHVTPHQCRYPRGIGQLCE